MLMKKIFTLLAAAAMTSTVMADVPKPDALYLVGTMNGWATPSSEDGRGYTLTDPDGDNIYSGSFDFDAGQLQFKVFTAPTDWGESNCYVGSNLSSGVDIYSDRKNTIYLNTSTNGGDSNVAINNWLGGKIEIQGQLIYFFDEANGAYIPHIIMTFNAPGQPTAGQIPECAYLIGDFNSYTLPSGTNLNGAIPVASSEFQEASFSQQVALPAGASQLLACVKDPATGNFIYYGNDAIPPFILCRYAQRYCTAKTSTDRTALTPFSILDWKGGVFNFGLNYDTGYIDFYGSPDSPDFRSISESVTLTTTTPSGTYSNFQPVTEGLSPEFRFQINDMLEGSMTINLDGNDVWGLETAETFTNEKGNPQGQGYVRRIVRGGAPIRFDLQQTSKVEININYCTGTLYIGITPDVGESHPERIYLVGAPQGWDITNNSMPLEEVSEGVYFGSFDIKAGDAMFRFYEFLGSWDNYSIGAQDWDSPIDIILDGSYAGIAVNGKGSWNIPDWKGGKIDMTVDLNTMGVLFSDPEAGVEGIEADQADPVFFNLQGIRVDNPHGGIFIKVSGHKAQTVRIP